MRKAKETYMMFSIPEEVKLSLRRMAAKQNLANPKLVTSAAKIVRQIVLDHLLTLKDMEENCKE